MEILFYHISFGISAQTLFRRNTVVLIELYLQISKEVNPSLSTTTWQVFTFVNFSRSKFAKNSYFETYLGLTSEAYLGLLQHPGRSTL